MTCCDVGDEEEHMDSPYGGTVQAVEESVANALTPELA